MRQPEERNNRKIVEGHGMEYFNADGNDPDVVYELCKALIEDTRRGGGPKYVELQTYRWREHCGPNYDDDLGYRSALEIKHWRKNDPIVLYGNRLKHKGVLNTKLEQEYKTTITEEITNAFEFATSSDYPDHRTIADVIYG